MNEDRVRMIVQCQSRLAFSETIAELDEGWQFQCRQERDHEGNHSTNVGLGAREAVSSEGPVVFRLDWRSNDGVVYQRWPKKES